MTIDKISSLNTLSLLLFVTVRFEKRSIVSCPNTLAFAGRHKESERYTVKSRAQIQVQTRRARGAQGSDLSNTNQLSRLWMPNAERWLLLTLFLLPND